MKIEKYPHFSNIILHLVLFDIIRVFAQAGFTPSPLAGHGPCNCTSRENASGPSSQAGQ